jgi:hypothetical protein
MLPVALTCGTGCSSGAAPAGESAQPPAFALARAPASAGDTQTFDVDFVSSTGSTVVGSVLHAGIDGARSDLFRWTAGQGLALVGLPSLAVATSADGNTVIALSATDAVLNTITGWRPFRCTAAAGDVPLPLPPGMNACDTRAGLTTSDAQTVFGRCSDGSPLSSGMFRWRNGAVDSLGALPPLTYGEPMFMSDDGRVVAGSIAPTKPGGASTSFRWTEAGGLVLAATSAAPSAPAASPSFEALDMSRDGNVIIGQLGQLPARWIEGKAVEAWPLPDGFDDGRPLALSDDGSVSEVRPTSDGTTGTPVTVAAIWDETNGVQLVADVLRARGIDLGGASLVTARISGDGMTLAGTATLGSPDRQAFLVARLSP